MRIGSNDYKLILLDTNAIREIIANTKNAGTGFFSKFYVGDIIYAPCFSIYNVIEIMPYKDIYEKFLDYFSVIPCLLIFPPKKILEEEFNSYHNKQSVALSNLVNAFTPFIDNDSYNCRRFFDKVKQNEKLLSSIQCYIFELNDIVSEWESQRSTANDSLIKMSLPVNIIDDNYYKFNEKQTVVKDLENWGINATSDIDLSYFSGARIMTYSHFSRVYMTKKPITKNDVMDIQISCIIPYIDAVITEGFQADVYKKAKNIIPQLLNLEIYSVGDIRLSQKLRT